MANEKNVRYGNKNDRRRKRSESTRYQQPVVIVYSDQKQMKNRYTISWIHLIVAILGLVCTMTSLYLMVTL